VSHRAGRRVDLAAGEDPAPQLRIEPAATRLKAARFDLEAKAGRAVLGRAEVVARTITTTASVLAASVDRYELTATRVVEKARDVFRDASDLSQTRVGRLRAIVAGIYSLHTQRSLMVSEEDTSIDGSKILLG
jgi:hypothetical protein